jgi:hypothetical protein
MSVDIKADYGAVGDGQLQTLTVSFTAGSNNLTVLSNTFTGVDVGKVICVSGWLTAVGSSGGNPSGGQGYSAASPTVPATISSVGTFTSGSQTLTLTGPAAAQTATGQALQVEWGTSDYGAFASFNTAQAGNSSVVLTIPAGRYVLATASTGNSMPVGKGIKSLTINGTGSPILSDLLGGGNGAALNFNGAPLFNDNTAESLIQTVNAGSTVLHMVTTADAAKYSANTWAWMTGYDIQGFGSPPNHQWSEFVFITAVNTGVGTVTLQSPLKNSYKSTWPKWGFGSVGSGSPSYTGGSFSLGGPATLYLIDQNWNTVQIWNGVGFRWTPTLGNGCGRSITINNAVFESFPFNVSFQQSCAINGIRGTVGVLWELDKGTEYFSLSDATIRGLSIQSPSPFNVMLDTVIVQNQFLSTTKNWAMQNCTIPSGMGFGASSYGICERLYVADCAFAGQTVLGGVKETNITTTGGYSCTNGLISRLKSGGTGEPPQWAVPGGYFFIGSRFNYENAVWRCLDIWDNGTTLFIQTDQSGGFPPTIGGTGDIAIIGSPPIITYVGNFGCDDAVSWSAVSSPSRMLTQWDMTYNGNIGASNPAHQVKVSGQLVSITITVGAGYSAGTLNLDSPFVVVKPGNTQLQWTPVVDLTVAGTRVINANGTVTGGGGADANLAAPNSGNIWLVSDQITVAMSGATGSGSVRLQIKTDAGFQAIAAAPLRLLMHA